MKHNGNQASCRNGSDQQNYVSARVQRDSRQRLGVHRQTARIQSYLGLVVSAEACRPACRLRVRHRRKPSQPGRLEKSSGEQHQTSMHRTINKARTVRARCVRPDVLLSAPHSVTRQGQKIVLAFGLAPSRDALHLDVP